MATWVTPSAISQSRNFSSSPVKVENSFTCWWRPLGPGVRTAAITVFLCTSRAAQRSTITSMGHPLSLDAGRAAHGVAWLKNLRLVLEATINGACGPRHQSDLRAHGTNELPGLGGRHPKSFIPNDAPG